ncbi:MAG TPA: amidinotransferase [Candidatus Saccharimonadia bacterium]|nr:amidinotransferase [Candidatus Saccharimonadia bacterium]
MQNTEAQNPLINRSVLMSGAEYFDVTNAINAYYNEHDTVDRARALADFANIRSALVEAGIKITDTPAPPNCQDGIFTANWGLCRGDTVVLSSLPPQRQAEQPYAEAALRNLGKRIVKPPFRFSGQGDALPCGNLLFAGSTYRTDPRMHQFLQAELGYEVIELEAVAKVDKKGNSLNNKLTGWAESYFYDLDLGISVLTPDLIAWYPGAWTTESQAKIRASAVTKIEVDQTEALNFNCNLISTGRTVVMGKNGPKLQAAIEFHGLKTITVDVQELGKGGGFIRCTTLTLDNV